MGIKTIPQPPYSPVLAPCDFCLFPKLSDCRYETIEEVKEAVTKVIDTLTHKDFHGAFQKLLERFNKRIAAGGDYSERGLEFHVFTINKSLETYLMTLINGRIAAALYCVASRICSEQCATFLCSYHEVLFYAFS